MPEHTPMLLDVFLLGAWLLMAFFQDAPCSLPLSAAPRLSRPTRRCPVCTTSAAAPPTP
ncbi:hypothetical protein T484DRAFT_1953413 [Baffinella frigidus]|nr:hypothetical protein T484DRAFT_1953413 [Cryptophyta sp. CCMP2293]